jgi:DNA-binding MarR family transcriptional regulator
MADVIQQLGALAFASRLKRLSERLQRDVSRIYREQKLEFHARWFPVAYLLAQNSPMSVTAIADALGLTHPAVNQIAAQMTRRGLLTSRKDKDDERRRLLSLTSKGRRVVGDLQPLWDVVEKCTSQLIKETGHDMLPGIAAIEKSLNSQEMYERIVSLLNRQRSVGAFHNREASQPYRRKSKVVISELIRKHKPKKKE